MQFWKKSVKEIKFIKGKTSIKTKSQLEKQFLINEDHNFRVLSDDNFTIKINNYDIKKKFLQIVLDFNQ